MRLVCSFVVHVCFSPAWEEELSLLQSSLRESPHWYIFGSRNEVEFRWTCLLCVLRLCKTAITWLRSLSAILPLFWRHDIAELHRPCREDFRNVLWRQEICDVFPQIMTCALQNMQFSQNLTTNLTFSLLTWLGSHFFLFISTHKKLSISGF